MNALALRFPRFGFEVTDVKRTLTAMLLVPVMLFTLGFACNVQSVVDRVNSILVEVGPALQIVVALLPLLSGKNVPADVITGVNAWIPRVQEDVTKLNNLIQQYQNDLKTNTTVQAEINALIKTTEDEVLSILPVFRVLDPALQQKLVAIVTAVGAAIISVENMINAAEGKVAAKAAPPGAKLVSNGKDFKKKFNSVLHSPTADPVVDGATGKLNL